MFEEEDIEADNSEVDLWARRCRSFFLFLLVQNFLYFHLVFLMRRMSYPGLLLATVRDISLWLLVIFL